MTEAVKTYTKDQILEKILSHFSLTSPQMDWIGNEFARSMFIYCLYLFGGFSPLKISASFSENWMDITKVIQDDGKDNVIKRVSAMVKIKTKPAA